MAALAAHLQFLFFGNLSLLLETAVSAFYFWINLCFLCFASVGVSISSVTVTVRMMMLRSSVFFSSIFIFSAPPPLKQLQSLRGLGCSFGNFFGWCSNSGGSDQRLSNKYRINKPILLAGLTEVDLMRDAELGEIRIIDRDWVGLRFSVSRIAQFLKNGLFAVEVHTSNSEAELAEYVPIPNAKAQFYNEDGPNALQASLINGLNLLREKFVD